MKYAGYPQVPGTCAGLDATAIARVEAFMALAVGAFALKDAGLLENLFHPGGDPRGRKNSREFDQALMDGGDTIINWTAMPYTEPNWKIMKTLQHHPPPTVWVDVMLNDGNRDYDYFFALAPIESGELRSCYYIDRVRSRKGRKP